MNNGSPFSSEHKLFFSQHCHINDLSEDQYDFIIPDDPLVPIKPCARCNHNKGLIVYTYRRWRKLSKRLSHFGLIRCDRCGSAITWIPKEGRELLIKKHHLMIAELDDYDKEYRDDHQ